MLHEVAQHQSDQPAMRATRRKRPITTLRPGESVIVNLRAEGYWHLRTLFEGDAIMVPPDEDLQEELTELRYKIVNSKGTIRIEEKEEMKKRLGGSPDRADSLMRCVVEKRQ